MSSSGAYRKPSMAASLASVDITRRSFSRGLLGAGLVAGVPGLLAACSSSSATSTSTTSSGPKDTMTVAYATDPAELDPALAFNPQSQEIIQNCYKSLIDFGTQPGPGGVPREDVNTITPVLAQSYTVSPDGKTYTFQLRQGVHSQDGHELTTADVQWSFDWMFNSGGAGTFLLSTGAVYPPVSHAMKILDKYSFELTATEPTPVTLEVMQIWIESIVDSQSIIPHTSSADPYAAHWLKNHCAGYGAYYLKSYVPGQQIVLAANTPSWNPPIKTVTLQIIPSPSDRAALMESGAVDIAQNLLPSDANRLTGASGVNMVSLPFSNVQYVGFNCRLKPTDNVMVRQALTYATPVEEIKKVVYYGAATIPTSYEPSVYPGASTYWPYSYNPAKAMQLLKAAGYPNGFTLELPWDTGIPTHQQTALILQSAWKEVGVTLNLQPLSSSAYAALLPPNTLTTNLFLEADFSVVPDPYYTLGLFFSTKGFHNFGHFSDPTLDAALAQGQFIKDQQQRLAIITQAQTSLVDGAPWVMCAYPDWQIALSSRVQGYSLHWDGLTRYDQLTLS
jgi:peptide/nickel transport system substrate-binding protein